MMNKLMMIAALTFFASMANANDQATEVDTHGHATSDIAAMETSTDTTTTSEATDASTTDGTELTETTTSTEEK